MAAQLLLAALSFIGLMCFIAGLSWPRSRFAPSIATGLVLLGFAMHVTIIGSWAGSCWDCTVGHEDTREFVFSMWLIAGVIVTAALIAVVWVGATATLLVRMLRPPKTGII